MRPRFQPAPEARRSLTAVFLAAVCTACGTTEEIPPADTGTDLSDTGGGDTTTDVEADTADVENDPEPDAPDLPDATDVVPTDVIDSDSSDASACEDPNPAGCRNLGCADGQVCWTDFSSEISCTPSSCECDAATGTWLCTEDCGGGACVPVPGAACVEDSDCPLGAQWCEEGLCEPCNNNAFVCDIYCEFGLLVRNGCHPCECAPPPTSPCGPEPQTGCVGDDDCGEGESCEPSALTVCLPSSCFCDEATGSWACTDDCLGSSCQPVTSACEGPNPQGCRSTGCDEGFECVTGDETVCIPSSCGCDEATGTWFCTEDCGGGVCVPEAADACETDSECAEGTHWCEDGACVECDNSGLACFLACGEGEELLVRNGCHPCECVRITECTNDDECSPWQRCEPGDLCLTWCAEGDPSCCFGNRCVDLPD